MGDWVRYATLKSPPFTIHCTASRYGLHCPVMTFQEPILRTDYYIDGSGILTYTKTKDEIKEYNWDLTDALASGETVASVSTEVNGVTLDSVALSTPVYTLTVSGTDGTIRCLAVTSDARKIERLFAFESKPRGKPNNDYRYSTGTGGW